MQKVNAYTNKATIFGFENLLMFQKKLCFLGLERYLLKTSQLGAAAGDFRRASLDLLTRVESGGEVEMGEPMGVAV